MCLSPLLSTLVSMVILHAATCFSPRSYQYKQYDTRIHAVVHIHMRVPEESKEKSLVDKVLRLDQANVFQRFGNDDNNDRNDYNDDIDDDDPDSNPFVEWMKKVNDYETYLHHSYRQGISS